MSRILFISIFISVLLPACSNETATRKHLNPAEIYFDYKIRGEEKDSSVTVYLQYRMYGPSGNAILLPEPAKVELDGERLSADSAKLTGAYYEIRKSADAFVGKHSIVFTDINGKEFREEFVYQPVHLKTSLPAVVTRGDLVFEFTGLEDKDYMRVSLVDTSFRSRDINEIDTVQNNKVIISADKLKNVVDGPITVLFYKDAEKPVKNGTRVGGRITLSYGMQREFELKTEPPKSP